jgi:hypothetical protein
MRRELPLFRLLFFSGFRLLGTATSVTSRDRVEERRAALAAASQGDWNDFDATGNFDG